MRELDYEIWLVKISSDKSEMFQENSPGKLPPGKFPSIKFLPGEFSPENSYPENSTRNISSHVFKHFVFSLLSPLSLILL